MYALLSTNDNVVFSGAGLNDGVIGFASFMLSDDRVMCGVIISVFCFCSFSYNDDIGRQKVVSEDSIEELNRHVRKENKVYCFPARQQCNLIGY